MDPTNTTVWRRKSFIGSVVSCRVDLSKTWVENHQWTPAESNKHHCMGKKEFDWLCGVMRG
jgi:hypothetical protein